MDAGSLSTESVTMCETLLWRPSRVLSFLDFRRPLFISELTGLSNVSPHLPRHYWRILRWKNERGVSSGCSCMHGI